MEPSHTYKLGERGRSFVMDGRTGTKAARIICKECGTVGSLTVRSLPPPEHIDKKFVQKGWVLDPNICPDCTIKQKKAKAAAKKEQQEMNTVTKSNGPLSDNPILKAVSGDTHKATAKMHQLLSLHFNEEDGRYAAEWSDERISKETGLSAAYVTEVRSVAYGELKEPEEITKLRSEIKALHELINETLITAQREVNVLNTRVAELTKKLGIK